MQEEVAERQTFLEEMECLGKGQKYRTIIETEISQVSRWVHVMYSRREDTHIYIYIYIYI